MPGPYLYLNLIPESLVASELPPDQFGSYMAVGPKFLSRGEAIFFKLREGFRPDEFPMGRVEKKCKPHRDGSPKCSVYLSIYRVLERIPIAALDALYLTTDDGRVLELQRGEWQDEEERQLYLYQEFCPSTPRVASRLGPRKFAKAITNRSKALHFPRIVFADLMLGDLAKDPLRADIGDLPYREFNHLRTSLGDLAESGSKNAKNISRRLSGRIHYRTVQNGFFVGDQEDFAYFPLPSRQSLEDEHRDWWRSAQTVPL